MFPQNSLDPNLPPNLPTLNLLQEQMEKGWRKVAVNELVRTPYEVFSLYPVVGWKLSCYLTSDGYLNRGVANYRAPQSWRAWFRVTPKVVAKWWRHLRGKC